MTASDLPHDWREWYEKRAAILEYMANLSRKQAEARALWLTQEAMRKAAPT